MVVLEILVRSRIGNRAEGAEWGGVFARHGFLPSLSTTEQLWRARYSVIIRIICNINIDKKVLNDLMMNVICGVVEYFVGLSDDVKIKQMTIIINGHIFPR